MIIKAADDKQPQLASLKTLVNHPSADITTQKRIKQEIRNIQAGIRGEEEAAYEMKVHYGESKNWMVLHDLRFEYGDLSCQIDHLIINRWLDMWVCESKHFSEGIAINEHSEFSAFFGNKPYGVASPLEQNNKHILILQRALDSGVINLPKRMGFTIKPKLKSLVLVSKKASITRPKKKIHGLECIVKNDQLYTFLDKDIDDKNNPLLMAKIIGQDTLLDVANQITKIHKPIVFNWPSKFGLPPVEQTGSVPELIETKVVKQTISSPKRSGTQVQPSKDQSKPKKKLICDTCGIAITYNVAKFCWFNKSKFGENLYCMECQKKV